MRRRLVVQMLVVAVLVTASCATGPLEATPTPTPTLTPPTIPTTIPGEVDDNAYYRCGGEVGYRLVELTDEIGQTPLTDNIMCPAMHGWQETLEDIRTHHGTCATPSSSHLLRARDSVDAALEKIAQALFYLSEYCRSPSEGQEYWDACLDAVLEAQFHMKESSGAFEAFIAAGAAEPGATDTAQVPTASPTATPMRAQTPGATPSVPPAVAPSPAPGFTTYQSRSLGFSAQYPEGWQVEAGDLQNPETGETVGKVAEFYTPYDPDAGFLQLLDIAVQIIAGIEGSPLQIPTDEEYGQLIRDWVTERDQELETDPKIVTVDGYKAAQVTYSGTDRFEQYTLVGYATFFVTEDRFFFVEGVAATENQAEMRSIYDHFMSTFDVLPLP
jgi:hypothetical protein